MLADFFVAAPGEALRYANRHEDPDEGEEIEHLLNPAQYKSITGVELGTLWAILEGSAWNVEKHMPEDIHFGDDADSWRYRFPGELTNLLANTDEHGLASAAKAWAKTEELDCNPDDLKPVLDDLRAVAQQEKSKEKYSDLWGCR